eukprot:gene5646-6067_t
MAHTFQPIAGSSSTLIPRITKSLTYGGGFPQRLFSILTYERIDSIAWFEDGSGFRLVDPVTFESTIISKYFKQRKIRSFFRQLNVYGFVRVSDPELISKYAFSHPLFRRNHPHLVDRMDRRKPTFSRRMMKDDEKAMTSEESDDALSQSSSSILPINNNIGNNNYSSSTVAVFSIPSSHRQRSPSNAELSCYSTDSQSSYDTTVSNNTGMSFDSYDHLMTSTKMEEDVSIRELGLYIDLSGGIDDDMILLQELLLMESPK